MGGKVFAVLRESMFVNVRHTIHSTLKQLAKVDKGFVPCNKYPFMFVPCTQVFVFMLLVIDTPTRPFPQVALGGQL